MRTVYFDIGELDRFGALGFISSEAEILPAGTAIHTEQAGVRRELPRYQEMAERAGVFFFFEDEAVPSAPFFAVPYMELVARDRDGGWYGRAAVSYTHLSCRPSHSGSRRRAWAGRTPA